MGQWGLFQLAEGERQGTPWTGCYSNTETFTLSFTPTANLESPINPTPCMSLDGGRRPEYPEEYLERTNADKGRTCKPHTERPDAG